MIVRDVMTKNVTTVSPDAAIKEVATQMCLNRISGMPVVDAEGAIVGIISEKDIFRHLFDNLEQVIGAGRPQLKDLKEHYAGVIGLRASDVMTAQVESVDPEMPVLTAAAMMWWHQFRRYPVVEGGKLVGIISMGDVHRAVFKESVLSPQEAGEPVHIAGSATENRRLA